MTNNFDEYKTKISTLPENEQMLRNEYLYKLNKGIILGPKTGVPSIDRPWVQFYEEDKLSYEIPNLTVYDYVKQKNEDNFSNTALEYFGKHITYNEFFFNVREAEKSFRNLGITEGDIVSFCVPTLPETFYAFYALNNIGAIANMIDPRTNVSNIKRFIDESNSKILFYIDIAHPKMAKILDELNVEKVYTMSAADSLPPVMKTLYKVKSAFEKKPKSQKVSKKIGKWNDFIEEGVGCTIKYNRSSNNLDRPSGIVYTSGTTGEPKGSLMTNKNFLAMVYQNWSANMGWDKNDIILGIMPPFIAYGMVCGFTLPLCNGMQIDIIPKFESEKFDEYILKHKPNHIMGVPSYLDNLTNSKKLVGKDLSFIKTAIVGGDKMVVSSEEKVNKFLKEHNSKARVSKGYGMTEMSSNAIYTVNDESNKLGSVGIPLIGNDFKIVNENNEELPCNEVGEVCLSGPTLINGYFNNEKETNKSFVVENGKRWIHTGDHALMDSKGRVYFQDRIKRIIVRSDGHNVWPSKIEKIIEEHPKVIKCCVTGVKESSNHNGEIPTAFIVIDKNYLSETEEIINEVNEECLRHLPERDIALQYIVKEDLPLTPVGKIDYRGLSTEGVEYMKNKKIILAKK